MSLARLICVNVAGMRKNKIIQNERPPARSREQGGENEAMRRLSENYG